MACGVGTSAYMLRAYGRTPSVKPLLPCGVEPIAMCRCGDPALCMYVHTRRTRAHARAHHVLALASYRSYVCVRARHRYAHIVLHCCAVEANSPRWVTVRLHEVGPFLAVIFVGPLAWSRALAWTRGTPPPPPPPRRRKGVQRWPFRTGSLPKTALLIDSKMIARGEILHFS